MEFPNNLSQILVLSLLHTNSNDLLPLTESSLEWYPFIAHPLKTHASSNTEATSGKSMNVRARAWFFFIMGGIHFVLI